MWRGHAGGQTPWAQVTGRGVGLSEPPCLCPGSGSWQPPPLQPWDPATSCGSRLLQSHVGAGATTPEPEKVFTFQKKVLQPISSHTGLWSQHQPTWTFPKCGVCVSLPWDLAVHVLRPLPSLRTREPAV